MIGEKYRGWGTEINSDMAGSIEKSSTEFNHLLWVI